MQQERIQNPGEQGQHWPGFPDPKMTPRILGPDRAAEDAKRQQRKPPGEHTVVEVIEGLERREAAEESVTFLPFQLSFLHQVHQAGAERHPEHRVAEKGQGDVHWQPGTVQVGWQVTCVGVEHKRTQGQDKADGAHHRAEDGNGRAQLGQQAHAGRQTSKERQGFIRINDRDIAGGQ